MSGKLKVNVLATLTLLILAMQCTVVQALTYHPRMDQALWIARSSVLQCRLIQPIPSFGRAIFNYEAGRELQFYLEAVHNPMEQGRAVLRSKAPRWNPELTLVDLGLVPVTEGSIPVKLDKALATRLLAELYKGKSPSFTRRPWYISPESNTQEDSEELIEVALSSVTFREAYSEYRQCLTELMPVGFDQLERSLVNFPSDKWGITAESMRWLDIVARYAVADPELDKIFIDGHTDDSNTTTYNVELSKNRAEEVMRYLQAKGVDASKFVIRYHGERFPVKSNKQKAGRAYNRRVTIRLQRIPETFISRQISGL